MEKSRKYPSRKTRDKISIVDAFIHGFIAIETNRRELLLRLENFELFAGTCTLCSGKYEIL